MGYRTYVNIKVEAFDASVEKTSDASKAFREIMEKAGCMQYQINDNSAEFEDNNANTLGKIVNLSKDHPGLLLQGTIDGTNEDRYDNRAFRIQAGCIEELGAIITFPEFRVILTKEEKEAVPVPSKEKKNISTTLSDCVAVLEGIANSGYIPFASPCPSSTEGIIKDSILSAISSLKDALNNHRLCYGRNDTNKD